MKFSHIILSFSLITSTSLLYAEDKQDEKAGDPPAEVAEATAMAATPAETAEAAPPAEIPVADTVITFDLPATSETEAAAPAEPIPAADASAETPAITDSTDADATAEQPTQTASVSVETLTQSSAETGDDSTWGATDYKHGFQIFPDKQLPPDLKLTDTEGKTHDLQDYRGKVVVLNFWGTHCPPCIKEIPSLENLQKKFSLDDFVVLSVNVGEDEEEVMMFLDNFATGYPVMLDPGSSTLKQWKLQAFPATFIIDQDGYLRLSYSGGLEWDQQGVVDLLAAEMQLQVAN